MLVLAENFRLAGDASTAAYPAAPDYFIDDDGRRSAPHEDNINRITHAGIVAGAPSGLSDPVTDPFTGAVIDCGEADVDCYGPGLGATDGRSVVEGKRGSGRVELGGRRFLKKKKKKK